MSRAVDVHAALVLSATLTMGTFFGTFGVFLPVPLVAVVQVLVRELWVRRMDEMGTDPTPPVDPPRSHKLPAFVGRTLEALRLR